MKRWLFLTFFFGLIGLPGTMFLVNTLEATNEVHITALVEDSNVVEQTQTVITTSGGGGGGGFNSSGSSASSSSDTEVSDPSSGTDSGSTDTVDNNTENTDSSTQDGSSEQGSEPEILPEPQAAIYFGGYAFPNAEVTFTLDGDIAFTATADEEGYFKGSFEALDLGDHVFTFQATSYDDQNSRLVSYAYNVQNESPLYISSVLLPPIFGSNLTGDGLGGVAIPGSDIQVYGVSQANQQLVVLDTIHVGSDGTYNYELDLRDGAYSQYYVDCNFGGRACGYSGIVPVQIVGEVYEIPTNVFADFTKDIKVNFVDFSFMRAAYLSDNGILFYDLDEDGELTLKDFSLLNYQWAQ